MIRHGNTDGMILIDTVAEMRLMIDERERGINVMTFAVAVVMNSFFFRSYFLLKINLYLLFYQYHLVPGTYFHPRSLSGGRRENVNKSRQFFGSCGSAEIHPCVANHRRKVAGER